MDVGRAPFKRERTAGQLSGLPGADLMSGMRGRAAVFPRNAARLEANSDGPFPFRITFAGLSKSRPMNQGFVARSPAQSRESGMHKGIKVMNVMAGDRKRLARSLPKTNHRSSTSLPTR
jgi:hypothetical protein